MFPELSDPCFWGTNGEEPYGPVEWTETSAGNPPNDRRGLSVMGPFTFEPESMERIDIAFVAAFPEGENSAIDQLMYSIDIVKDEYYQDPTYFGYQWLGIEDNKIETNNRLVTYPNPVTNNLTVIYEGDDENASYKLTDIMGKVIFTGKIKKEESITLDLEKLNNGMFVVSVIDKKMIYSSKVIKK